jgi:nicotinamide mononucleotide (NMN) deamidase PncC
MLIPLLKEKLGSNKLRIIVTGAGISLADLAIIPGASEIIDGIIIPYSKEALNGLLDQEVEKSVSKETVAALLQFDPSAPITTVAISGGITTNRYRKGDNHAYIGIGAHGIFKYYHVNLDKLSEEEYSKLNFESVAMLRHNEDTTISSIVINILLGKHLDEIKGQMSNIKELVEC